MEKELVPNNTTLASLRGLLRAARKNVLNDVAIHINLSIWHYALSPTGAGAIRERIEIYRSGTGDGAKAFKSVKEAREYIDSWKEEEDGSD